MHFCLGLDWECDSWTCQEEVSFQQQQAAIRKARGVLADSENRDCPVDQQTKGLPFCWTASNNLKPRPRQNGRVSRGQPSSWPGQAPGVRVSSQETVLGTPVTAVAVYGGAQGADIDLQYDGYFRGFFASLDEGQRHQLRGQAIEPHRTEPNPSQENLRRIRLEVNRLDNGTPIDGHAVGIQLTRAYSPFESVYGSQQRTRSDALPSTSGSGSGSQHVGTAPSSWQTRSFSSASGESGEYLTSGRTSYSYRASSTSLTNTTCSGSGSGSGSSRRNRSTTAGSMSYGEAGAGSVSTNSVEINHVEYVVSSRTTRPAVGPADMEIDEAPTVSAGVVSSHGGNTAAFRLETANVLPVLPGSRSVDARVQLRNSVAQTASVEMHEHPPAVAGSLSLSGNVRTHINAERPGVGQRNSGNLVRGGRIGNSLGIAGRALNTMVQDVEGAALPPHTENGNSSRGLHEAANQGGQTLGGLKQRLLSYIFRGIWNEDVEPLVV